MHNMVVEETCVRGFPCCGDPIRSGGGKKVEGFSSSLSCPGENCPFVTKVYGKSAGVSSLPPPLKKKQKHPQLEVTCHRVIKGTYP